MELWMPKVFLKRFFYIWKLVTGSVQLQIKYFAPKIPRKVHAFSVTVVKAKDLVKTGESGRKKLTN
jgi:hypothetical protein